MTGENPIQSSSAAGVPLSKSKDFFFSGMASAVIAAFATYGLWGTWPWTAP